MSGYSRRRLLAVLGSSVTVAAGCTESAQKTPPPSTTRNSTTAETTARTSTAAETETATETDGPDTTEATETPASEFYQRLETTGTWSQYMYDAGNTGNSEASGVPTSGSIYWKHGRGGSPVVADQRVYTVERHGDTSLLTERDLRTGELRRTLDVETGSQGYWVATLGDTIVVPTFGRLVSVDARRWRTDWTTDISEGPVYPPTVSESSIYLSVGAFGGGSGAVSAIDASTGQKQWTNATSETRAVAVGRDGLVLYPDGKRLLAVDPDTGTVLWHVQLDSTILTNPVAGREFVCFADQKTLRCVDTDDGTERWAYSIRRGTSNGLAVAGGTVFVSDDEGIECIDAEAGTRRWRVNVGRAGVPTVGSDAVYVGTKGNGAQFVVLDASTGEERWSHVLPETTVEGDVLTRGTDSPPTIVEDGVLLRAVDGLYAFGQ